MGSYATIGSASPTSANTAEWFLLYRCGATTAQSVVLSSCFGDYGTCPKTAAEGVAQLFDGPLSTTTPAPGEVVTATGTGCFYPLGGAVLLDGTTGLGGDSTAPAPDGSFAIPLTVPAATAPGTRPDGAARLRDRRADDPVQDALAHRGLAHPHHRDPHHRDPHDRAATGRAGLGHAAVHRLSPGPSPAPPRPSRPSRPARRSPVTTAGAARAPDHPRRSVPGRRRRAGPGRSDSEGAMRKDGGRMSWKSRGILLGRCLLAGGCIAASLPPWGWWPLAFVGIALLDRLIAGQSWKARFRRTWLVAAAWLYPGMLWIWDLTAPGYLIAGAFYAGYFAVAGALCPPGRSRWLALPGLMLLAEVARWSFPFGGVPLATLAMSQAEAPLAQTARLLGSYLVVVLVVAGGVALSAAWEHRWRVAGGILAGLVALWAVALVAPRGHDTAPLRIAIVQGGGPQRTRAVDTDAHAVFERHLQASEQIQGPVDLVVWPENVVSLDGRLDGSPEDAALSDLARRLHTTLVVGVTENVDDHHFLNAAVVYEPDGSRGDRYDKVRTVPFGEYVPLRSLIERVAGANSGLPERDAVPGTGPAVLHTPVGTLGTVISWEVFFDGRARDAISHGGEVLLNPTNGSSYWLTIVQSQQVASSRLRAIETGRWTLQAAPTGFSAIVTPEGRVTQRTGVSEQAVLSQTITERHGQTLATIVGPWPVLGLSLLAIGGGWWLERRSTSPPDTLPDAATSADSE